MKLLVGRVWKNCYGLRGKACLVAVAVAGLWHMQPLRAAALTDFGYQNRNVNGKPASGTRPLLAIFVTFAGQAPLPQSLSYYSNLIFSTSQPQSMRGYYQACSDGGFSVVPGGAIMLSLSATESRTNFDYITDKFAKDGVYASNIIAQAMLSGQFDFSSYDLKKTGHITVDELAIMLVVSDADWNSGGSRMSPTVSIPGLGYDWGSGDGYPNVSIMGTTTTNGAALPAECPFIVWCEELEETWGAKDIYSAFPDKSLQCLSQTLTPQSCYFDTTSLIGSYYYLDPWNRLELGWCQPRIYSMATGGIATIPAAQAGDPSAPTILYDPVKGTNEFFILEYRTSSNAVYGAGYDQDVGNDHTTYDPVTYGLVIWHVQQDANHDYVQVTSPTGVTNTDSVWAESSPDLIPSEVPSFWGSNSTTPNLKWMDGTQTLTTIHVRPFSIGDNTIVVAIRSALDTWVDFSFTGPQSGTFANPYNTMAAGTAAVSFGGILHLKTGRSSETPKITKPMQVVGYNGPATVGN